MRTNRTFSFRKTLKSKTGAGLFLFFWICFSGWTLFGADGDEQYNKAFTFWQQKNWNQAITDFENFIRIYPTSSKRNDAELRLADSYFNRNSFMNAEDGIKGRNHLDYIIKQGKQATNYKQACLHYAFSLYSLGDYSGAKPRLEEYLRDYPKDDSLQYAYYYLGMCESNLGNYSNAENYFTTCLNTFPNGALRAECQLDRAVSVGKSGRYQEADQELSTLALNPDFKLSKQAHLQRARLKMDQQDYQGALQFLEGFISRYKSDPNLRMNITEAYQYEAQCYVMLKNYDAAYRVSQELERLDELSPEAKLLRVNVLTKMKQFDQARAIMDQLKNSKFGLYASDILTYNYASIALEEGKWGNAIDMLIPLLDVRNDPANPNGVLLNYYNNSSGTGTKLRPIEFVAAGGTLLLAYANRYAATHQYENDNAMQNAIFDALYRYANQQSDKQLIAVLKRIDHERGAVLSHQMSPSTMGTLQPSGSLTPVVGNQSLGQPSGREYGPGYRPNDPNGSQLGGSGLSNYPGQSTGNGTAVNIGQLGQGTSSVPGGYTGQYPLNQNNYTGYGQQQGNHNGLGGVPGTIQSSRQSGKKITELEASETLNRAGELCTNGEYERANNLLLSLLISSETFWTDCPTIAPAVALQRAKILFLLNNFREARQMCGTLVKVAPNSAQAADANYYLGYCEDYFGNREKAVEYFEKTIQSPYESLHTDDAYYYLGLNEWERKNTNLAEEYFRKILRSYENGDYSGHAAWALAQIEFNARNYKNAEKIVNNALENKPDLSIIDWLLFLKGEIASRLNDYEKARTAYNFIITHYPDSQKIVLAKNRLENLPRPKNVAPEKF